MEIYTKSLTWGISSSYVHGVNDGELDWLLARFWLRQLAFKMICAKIFISMDLQLVINLALTFNGKLRMLEVASDECRNNLSI